jgi:hypothetical protein
MKELTIITRDRNKYEFKDTALAFQSVSRYHAYTKEFGISAYLYEFGATRKEARQKLKEKCKGFKNVFESLFKEHDLPMTRNGIVEHEEFWLSLYPSIKHDGKRWFKSCPPYVVLSVAVKFKSSKKDGWDFINEEIKTIKEYKEFVKKLKNKI